MFHATLQRSGGGMLEALERARVAGLKAFEESVERITDLIFDLARDNAPVNTGAMREAIERKVEKTDDGYKATIEATGGLIYVEYGTGLRSMWPSKNGLPKNPVDIPHTSKPTWFIPFSQLTAAQISDLTHKYHYRIWESESGEQYFIAHGQAPQPFMYPAAIVGFPAGVEKAREWFKVSFMSNIF